MFLLIFSIFATFHLQVFALSQMHSTINSLGEVAVEYEECDILLCMHNQYAHVQDLLTPVTILTRTELAFREGCDLKAHDVTILPKPKTCTAVFLIFPEQLTSVLNYDRIAEETSENIRLTKWGIDTRQIYFNIFTSEKETYFRYRCAYSEYKSCTTLYYSILTVVFRLVLKNDTANLNSYEIDSAQLLLEDRNFTVMCSPANGAAHCRARLTNEFRQLTNGGKLITYKFEDETELKSDYFHAGPAITKCIGSPLHLKNGAEHESLIEVLQLLVQEAMTVWIRSRYESKGFCRKFLGFYTYHALKAHDFPSENFYSFDELVILKQQCMNFLSCHGVGQNLDFSLYLRPFDPAIWIFIITISGIVLPLLTACFYYYLSKPTSWKCIFEVLTQTFLFTFSVNLEVSPTEPTAVKMNPKLAKLATFTLFLWPLVAVTLVNAYKGIVVSDLNLPLAVHGLTRLAFADKFVFITPINVWSTLVDQFSVYSYKFGESATGAQYELGSIADVSSCLCSRHGFTKFQSSYLANCKDVAKHLANDGYSFDNLGFYPELCEKNSNFPWRTIKKLDQENTAEPSSLKPFKDGLFPAYSVRQGEDFYSNIFEFTKNCWKSGYIDYDEELDGFLAYTEVKAAGSKTKVVYAKGQEGFLNTYSGIIFEGEDRWACRLGYNRLQLLLASGIYHLWEKCYEIEFPSKPQKLLKLRKKIVQLEDVRKLDLNSNLTSGFVILVVLLSVAFAFFLLEKCRSFLQPRKKEPSKQRKSLKHSSVRFYYTLTETTRHAMRSCFAFFQELTSCSG